jgi:hypothetical protein
MAFFRSAPVRSAPFRSAPVSMASISLASVRLAPRRLAPRRSAAEPGLTERDIFELDAAGDLAPEITAVLLRLMQRGLCVSLDLPGLITATGISPLEDVCRYVECTGGVIPESPGSIITLAVIEEPINPVVGQDYMVWLADLDGVTLIAEKISWSADQLELAGNGPSTVNAGRVKSVELKFPQFDLTVSEFIDDYNDVFLEGLKNSRMRPLSNVL